VATGWWLLLPLQEVKDALLGGMAQLIDACAVTAAASSSGSAEPSSSSSAVATPPTAECYLQLMAAVPSSIYAADDGSSSTGVDRAICHVRAQHESPWSGSLIAAERLAAQLGRCAAICRRCGYYGRAAGAARPTRRQPPVAAAAAAASEASPPALPPAPGDPPPSVAQLTSVEPSQLTSVEPPVEPSVELFGQLSRQLLHRAYAARVRKAAAVSAAEILDVLHRLPPAADDAGDDAPAAALAMHSSSLVAHGRRGAWWERLLLVWVCDAALTRLQAGGGGGGGCPAAASAGGGEGCRHFLRGGGPASQALWRLAQPASERVANVRAAAGVVLERRARYFGEQMPPSKLQDAEHGAPPPLSLQPADTAGVEAEAAALPDQQTPATSAFLAGIGVAGGVVATAAESPLTPATAAFLDGVVDVAEA
jgi:hypothetical protein